VGRHRRPRIPANRAETLPIRVVLADGSAAGRDGLLTINETVIVPAEQALEDL